jgi:hypothetical protein
MGTIRNMNHWNHVTQTMFSIGDASFLARNALVSIVVVVSSMRTYTRKPAVVGLYIV